jgi:hypothetical protein
MADILFEVRSRNHATVQGRRERAFARLMLVNPCNPAYMIFAYLRSCGPWRE